MVRGLENTVYGCMQQSPWGTLSQVKSVHARRRHHVAAGGTAVPVRWGAMRGLAAHGILARCLTAESPRRR
jgi:hypothetical protein